MSTFGPVDEFVVFQLVGQRKACFINMQVEVLIQPEIKLAFVLQRISRSSNIKLLS